ncbi:hypothetical protein Zm00014a_002875 [Zea mays]|uniref:Uncharacterized protein n=1 Tax=Zea mays TaxID=4577 RepID=A0A3L6G382_MAIZE|nr:hypothetical protein Zm00014a_002875 [Zea mays]
MWILGYKLLACFLVIRTIIGPNFNNTIFSNNFLNAIINKFCILYLTSCIHGFMKEHMTIPTNHKINNAHLVGPIHESHIIVTPKRPQSSVYWSMRVCRSS